MSEEPGKYHIYSRSSTHSASALRARRCLKDIRDIGYRPPTVVEIRSVFNMFGMNQESIAMSLGVSVKTLQTWVVDSALKTHVPIPYPVWRLCLHETNLIESMVTLDQAISE